MLLRSTDTDEELATKQLIACRPGLLGILAEALYCPQMEQARECPASAPAVNNKRKKVGAGAAGGAGDDDDQEDVEFPDPPPPPRKPTLIEILLNGPSVGGSRRRN